MPVNATKRASILRFDDLPLQHLQATRYKRVQNLIIY